ncbi:hypothetical protein PCL1606_16900 [Pseudomonas chlororaphis]|uniref:Uncharacterized protein n=1 Tax=Pseudomonas chlororaphis TaxID=587753 RepID=A0A0D5XWU5_9PSED|nr:hypothetical protein PCL1606_16900 [Pseudomonas chlororaphis]
MRTHAQRLLTRIGSVYVLDAQFAQHGPDRTAEVGEIIDDQKALLVVRQHRGFQTRKKDDVRSDSIQDCRQTTIMAISY